MGQIKITPRITKSAYDRLVKISLERAMPLAEIFREMLELGLTHYEQKTHYPGFESFGKNRLTRAERAALFSSVLTNLIFQQQVTKEALAELKQRAKSIINERWDYLDDE